MKKKNSRGKNDTVKGGYEVAMTIQEYKQQLYDACKEHIFLAQQALDRYATAKTDREREYAKIDNLQHLAAHNSLQWALYKASEIENMGRDV